MLGKFYEDVFDVELYCQMVDLICRLSEHAQKERLYCELENSLLLFREPEQGMEEAYGLRYPGEVLERLDEKEEVTERQLRALGLALAGTKECQSDGMFIGKQKPSFWKRMKRSLKKSDLYWLGIQYLLEDGKRELYEKLLSFPVQSIEELVFILSILPDERDVWEKAKGKLNLFLGKERKFSVYTHTEIYAWLVAHYHPKVKGYQKKDIPTLKYLLRLPFSYAKEGSAARRELLKAGYTVQEILYLSMSLLYQRCAADMLKKDGLTVERMAVETCLRFLEGSGEYLDVAGDFCRRILEDYSYFHVKLEDTTSIFDRLYELLKVENARTYQLLLSCDRNEERHSGWYRIDLTDPRWQELYFLIDENRFIRWVFETLSYETYGKEKMEQYLSIYRELTGESFLNHFWNKKNYALNRIFSKLAELELLDPFKLLKEYLSEYHCDKEKADKKWECMADHLMAYMKGVQTPKAAEMLFQIVEETGISDKGLFAVEGLLLESFGMEYGSRTRYYYSNDHYDFSGTDLIRPFLSTGDHQKLFRILERHIFVNYPDRYHSFLIGVLSKEDHLLWFPKEEAREVFLVLAETLGQQRKLENLRGIYLTEEELDEFHLKKQERERRHLLLEKKRKIDGIRKEFTRQVAEVRNTDRHFAGLYDYAGGYCYESDKKKEKCYITKRYLCSLFQGNFNMLLERKEAGSLCDLLKLLFMEGELTFAEVKRMLGFVEVKENRKEAA